MKKKIGSLILLLFIAMMFCSCGKEKEQEQDGLIIEDEEIYGDDTETKGEPGPYDDDGDGFVDGWY